MIIVEGTDLLGKTTFAQKIVKVFNQRIEAGGDDIPSFLRANMRYQHLTKPPVGWNYTTDYMYMLGRNVVQDRLWLSEMAYGTIARGHTFINDNLFLQLESQAASRCGAVSILFYASEELIRHRWSQKGDRPEMFDLDTVIRVNEAFKYYSNTFHLYNRRNWVVIELTGEGYPAENDLGTESLWNRWLDNMRELQHFIKE